MTTDDNSNPVDMEDFNSFKDSFFSDETDNEPVVNEDEGELEGEDEELSNENEDVDPLANEDEDAEDEELEEEPEPKPKKRNRTQERIEQLVTEARIAERERDTERRLREALERELLQLRDGKQEVKTEEAPLKDKLSPEAPKPYATNDEGEPLYPRGEFDPLYIADLSKFTVAQMLEETKKQQELEAKQREVVAEQEALKQNWNDNLDRAEESLPDIRENIATMATTFEGIEPTYGEYLAGTIMSCEYGPEIMYYLSQNIGEAQKIVASGPAAATLAIGRLEARFEGSAKQEEAKRNTKKVSDAPPPPNERSRGSGGRFAVAPDTRDLAAFRREFYKDLP